MLLLSVTDPISAYGTESEGKRKRRGRKQRERRGEERDHKRERVRAREIRRKERKCLWTMREKHRQRREERAVLLSHSAAIHWRGCAGSGRWYFSVKWHLPLSKKPLAKRNDFLISHPSCLQVNTPPPSFPPHMHTQMNAHTHTHRYSFCSLQTMSLPPLLSSLSSSYSLSQHFHVSLSSQVLSCMCIVIFHNFCRKCFFYLEIQNCFSFQLCLLLKVISRSFQKQTLKLFSFLCSILYNV